MKRGDGKISGKMHVIITRDKVCEAVGCERR